VEPFLVLAPFELATGDNRVEQIVWWGSPSSNEFTIGLRDSIIGSNGELGPRYLPFFSITAIANSMKAGPLTDLFWIDLPSPVDLSAGLTYLSITASNFAWHESLNDGVPPYTVAREEAGVVWLYHPVDGEAAFVLNDTIGPIPEPSTAVLLAFGLTALAARRTN
jgi:hypothetical protein